MNLDQPGMRDIDGQHATQYFNIFVTPREIQRGGAVFTHGEADIFQMGYGHIPNGCDILPSNYSCNYRICVNGTADISDCVAGRGADPNLNGGESCGK